MPVPRYYLGTNVFDEALHRLSDLYAEGHRVIVSFSGGKDSGVCLELAIIAARETGRLPVEVVMRDDEIMFPGTFEYCERVAARPEVDFTWIVANQPVINMFNRENPYFWALDPDLSPEQWLRRPPEWATYIKENYIEAIVVPSRYPPAPGRDLYSIIGMRTQESSKRMAGLYSSKGWLTKANRYGCRYARPIYDWQDGDVWKAHLDNGWDYNIAYDTMHRLGISRTRLRIAPPTQTQAAIGQLWVAARAWPRWFDKVCDRCPGVRAAAMYGMKSIYPFQRLGESWQECFQRECIDQAPMWISQRAIKGRDHFLRLHSHHSTEPFPQVETCLKCSAMLGSWKALAQALYMGDAFGLKLAYLPPMEPQFFRDGAGTWEGGRPSF